MRVGEIKSINCRLMPGEDGQGAGGALRVPGGGGGCRRPCAFARMWEPGMMSRALEGSNRCKAMIKDIRLGGGFGGEIKWERL